MICQVCGINSCIKKGFDFYVKAENPDILILTETKADKEVDNETIKSRYPVRIMQTCINMPADSVVT